MNVKRAKGEQQALIVAGNRLSDAVLQCRSLSLFLMDAKGKVLRPVSRTLTTLFRRADFSNLTFEKLLAPLVSAKTLTVARAHVAALLGGAPPDTGDRGNPLGDVEVRLPRADGSFDTMHYSFDFDLVAMPNEPEMWLVRVTDVTAEIRGMRELEELRNEVETQGEILRGVLQMGGARFGSFMHKTDASMKTIATVLKKPAREEETFRNKLVEILDEVDRIGREAAAFKLTAMESTARVFEAALQELRGRKSLSGSDFLPLAVKLDDLCGQFALIKTLTVSAAPARDADLPAPSLRAAGNGVQPSEASEAQSAGSAPRIAQAGSLDGALQALTGHVAQEHGKDVLLDCHGLQNIPPRYQAAVKNVAIQLIRNAVMHGIEAPQARIAVGKLPRGTLRLELRVRDDHFELLFEDDGRGLVADEVRATAIARGVVPEEAAVRMRDREAIKLIFKSRFTTLTDFPGDTRHGSGLSLVRRYVHEAGGKIALASLPGHETRFKITLPALATAASRAAEPAAACEPAAAEPSAPPTATAELDAAAADGDVDAAGTAGGASRSAESGPGESAPEAAMV